MSWFALSCIAFITNGLLGFLSKVFAERKIDGAIFAVAQGPIYLLFGAVLSWYYDVNVLVINSSVLLFIVLGGALVYFFNLLMKVKVLQHLSASEYFIGYRIGVTVLLIIVGYVLYSETISSTQWIGLGIGTIALFLLFEEQPHGSQRNRWKIGIILLLLSILLGILVQYFGKSVSLHFEYIFVALFHQGWMVTIIFSILFRKKIRTFFHTKHAFNKNYIPLILAGVFSFLSTITNILAFQAGGKMGIIGKMQGYAVFIPIILSFIIYHEKITRKKVAALVLSGISLLYLN